MKITFEELATLVHAENDWQSWSDVLISGVEFDSRLIQEGNLFVPLKGATDGHTFIAAARKNGAHATFWAKDNPDYPLDFPVLLVADPLEAMQRLAAYYLEKTAPSVIAVTGSNGKTTTKDLIASVLAQQFITYKTQGNYNNQIGLPYTILHMPEETEKLVLEMGMDHQGEIAFLSNLAKPDVAVITMIGEAHIENLGSKAAIADAKMEITTGLAPDGLLVFPDFEPLLFKRSNELSQTIQTIGEKQTATIQLATIQEEKEQTTFTVKGETVQYQIPVPGKYNVMNALLALAVGRWFGLNAQQIQQGLAQVQLTQNRTQWLNTPQGVALLSDVYNANPTAMQLVLESFSQLATDKKRSVVLGDMLELGAQSTQMHAALAAYIQPDKIQEIYLIGEQMHVLYEALKNKYPNDALHYFKKEERQKLIAQLQQTLSADDMILLKGSNSMQLELVVNALMAKPPFSQTC